MAPEMSSHHFDNVDPIRNRIEARDIIVVACGNGNLRAFHPQNVRDDDHLGIEVVVILQLLKGRAFRAECASRACSHYETQPCVFRKPDSPRM